MNHKHRRVLILDYGGVERDAIKMNRVTLYISLWSRDLIRLTGTHLIASRSIPLGGRVILYD